ncbi:histidine phosphatase family protein [Bacillus sp. 31A1R]|uniref:Histidine phosphatase family protein n=1 Tax=Robertmurraya mangrovi TaxID=3098077 RepID=A0ABU5J100_9BACI|nr:histidine phosphatase family protein [Bacillus sp. 31A1R]MDZ5473098.1 histidine phosphatase family protein [Bacillus sp. 31A1R]
MLTLYITRHGETVWNTEKRLQGWSDSELTVNGENNAKFLGDRLKDVHFTSIYTSPSARTLQTAKLISTGRDIPIHLNSNLREIHMGEWEGNTHEEIQKYYPTEYQLFWNAPHLYKPLSGEGFVELNNRVLKALDEIKSNHTSGNILIVTHTVVIKCLLAHFNHKPLERLWDPPFIHDTSLSVVEVEGEQYRVVIEGDSSHKVVE